MKLKKLITELESYRGKSLIVQNDLIVLINAWDSYRGSYDCPAIEYRARTYDNPENAITTVDGLLELLYKIKGSTMTGWKGGEFIVDDNLEVFVSNSGVSSHNYISGLRLGWCLNIELSQSGGL